MLAGTRQVWIETLWGAKHWHESDAVRIGVGFRVLAARIDRWPTPRQLLAALPERAQSDLAALPPRAFTDEERAANLDRLQRMIGEALR